MSLPFQERRPAAGASRVASMRSRLDLPLPLGPLRISAPPAGRRQFSPSNTSRSPRRQARPSPARSAAAGKVKEPGQKKAAPEGENRSRKANGHDGPKTRFGGQTCKGGPYALKSRVGIGLRYAQNEAIP